jgi:hypothetical protein
MVATRTPSIAEVNRASPSVLRPLPMMLHPRRARCTAMARPKSPLAPVIKATGASVTSAGRL